MKNKSHKRLGCNSIDNILSRVLSEIMEKQGFVTQRLAMNWGDIIGKSLASISYPEKIIFDSNAKINGVLIIEISNPGFALEVQSFEKIIISRVNSYFGYSVIAKIRLKIVKI